LEEFMTEITPRLSLPLLMPAQAQKHVTHNEALMALDAIVHLAVLGILDTPPSEPDEGDRFIVGGSPTGAFSAHTDEIAAWQDGAWNFHEPGAGWVAWLATDGVALVFDGSAWVDLKARSADRLGVAMAADGTNRLAAASPAVLFTHDGDDCQVKVNKAAAGDTASLLFQTNFSGRAEFGLAGDDKFHVKVSPDGSAWSEVLVADPASGNVGIGTDVPSSRLHLHGAALVQAQIKCRTEATGTLMGGGLIFQHNNAAGALPVANDRLGYILFGTVDGGVSRQAAGIAAYADGNFTTSPVSMPARFAFETAPANSGARVQRLVIASDGNIGVGVTAPATKLDVDGPVKVKSYTVAGLPAAGIGAGSIVFVSNEAGGAVLAFSDGTSWRRVTDRAVVS
jgi:hypothetical protein